MRWFSRLHRPTELPMVLVTVTTSFDRQVDFRPESPWQLAFSALDEWRIPATWAVPMQKATELAKLAVASSLSHELAYLNGPDGFSNSISEFRNQQLLARTADLPLCTLVSPGTGIHPSLLKQLSISAVVPTGRQKFSRTGQFRALAWNTWEAPPTDRVTLPLSPDRLSALGGRLQRVLRQSTRLHVLLDLQPTLQRRDLVEIGDWMRAVADYARRGWLELATIGQQATELNHSIAAKESPAQAA